MAINFEDINMMEIFEFITDTYEINITVDLAFTPPTIRQINLRNVPLRSVFLALADKMGDACFVIRDYGLFLTTRERAQTLAGPTIPEDIPYFAHMPMHGGFGGGHAPLRQLPLDGAAFRARSVLQERHAKEALVPVHVAVAGVHQ